MKHKIIITSLLCMVGLSSCFKKHHCQSFNSEVVSDTVSTGSFHSINLEMEADIIYTQGLEQSIVIEAPEKLMEHLSITVFQNTLTFDVKNNFCYINKKQIKIYITNPSLSDISIEGSGNFVIANQLNTDDLSINISGSGDFYADSISTKTFSTNISGSGDIFMAGVDTITKQTIKISGSGDINTLGIPSDKTKISISGSGNCSVYTLNELDVKISGSGDVRYIGSPIVNSSITGSGSVKHY